MFLELPCVPCDVWGGYCSWQSPHLLPEEVGKFFCAARMGGPAIWVSSPSSQASQVSQLFGVWACGLPGMAAFFEFWSQGEILVEMGLLCNNKCLNSFQFLP